MRQNVLIPSDEPQFIRNSPRPLRFARRCLVLITIITTAATGGWYAARAYYAPYSLGLYIDDGAPDRHFAAFNKLADAVKAYLQEHDGYLPADVYRALIESGKVDSFSDFWFVDRVVEFDMMDLPARLNVQLAKNPNHALFSVYYETLDEEWSMLMNGQVVRRKISRPAGKAIHDELTWSHNLHNAGYPYWESVTDKQKWLDANRQNLQWDPALEMYVPLKPNSAP
jgi:hypothetical protein